MKDGVKAIPVLRDGKVVNEEVPYRNAVNEVLREEYISDCERALRKWNRTLEKAGVDATLTIPSRRFHRQVGIYSDYFFTPEGELISEEEFEKNRDKWLLKQIAQRYLPSHIVNRKKAGFPLPLQDYLAPLAQTALFDEGFCHHVLGLHPHGLRRAVESWPQNVHAFFNLVTLEIWGRLFILQEPLDQVNELTSKLEYQHAS